MGISPILVQNETILKFVVGNLNHVIFEHLMEDI